MNNALESWICSEIGAASCTELGVVQSLWSGYGSIVRYALVGAEVASVILKRVSPPDMATHPRGWNTDFSHQRKLKSYAVEAEWYSNYADRCGIDCRVPRAYAVETSAACMHFLMEDLDGAGFPGRRSRVGLVELRACLQWLAHFHAEFLGVAPAGLWCSGTYWHLQTRPDELIVLQREDPQLWSAASAIDAKLSATAFSTLVHGDAKLANFCFSKDGTSVAMVDFQYVGGGCGMKDVAYFIGSCLDEIACEAQAPGLLDLYFDALNTALKDSFERSYLEVLEEEWRMLYAYAWADFHRFLKGWSPGHWKMNSYSEQLCRDVIAQIEDL